MLRTLTVHASLVYLFDMGWGTLKMIHFREIRDNFMNRNWFVNWYSSLQNVCAPYIYIYKDGGFRRN